MKMFFPLLVVVAVAGVHPILLRAQESAPSAPSATPAMQTGGEIAALAAEEVWLGLIDDGRFAESWKTSASIFQKAVPQEQWLAKLNAHRIPFGKLLSRHRKNSQFTKMLPGAPDGQYVVIQYDTSFENKKTAIETVTAMLDGDGQWKVSGYYVR